MLRVVRGVSCCNAASDILVQSCCCTTGFMPNIACSNLLLYHQYGAKSVFRVVKPFSTTTTSDNKSYNYSSSTFSFPPIRVAIVGAGPAGFYTAKYLLKGTAQLEKFGNEGVHIDLLDRLPTPFGLVRSGVAPDHPEVKNVQTDFSEIAEHPRVNFRGNVKVGAATSGTGLSLSDLMKAYHCVVLAYGAESSKELTIPGAHLRGVISARDFVGWYNGHPDFAHLSEVVTEGLSHPSGNMAVIGVGNVALDCARILAKGGSSLAHTDCAAHALEVLTPDLPPSSRRRIWVLGRRGHAQASFTIKELRELTRIPTTDFVVRDDELQAGRGEESSAALQERPRQRIEKVLNEAAAKASSSSSSDANSNKTEVSLRFLVSPVRVVGDGKGSVCGLDIERNRLVSGEGRVVGIRGMGELEHFPCGLVLVSIGYRTLPLHGVPFDHRRGIICNKHGRVQGLQGVYCSGWAKRGPTGIIATNILDAKDTVKSIVDDLKGELVQGLRTVKPGWNGLKDTVRSAAVGWEQYKCIDEAEVALGVSCGKPREKIVSRSDLLRAAKKGGASLIG